MSLLGPSCRDIARLILTQLKHYYKDDYTLNTIIIDRNPNLPLYF